MCPEQQNLALVVYLSGGNQFLRLVECLVDEIFLGVVETLHVRFVLDECLIARLFNRTGNDERGTGIVDEHGVDLVHDGEMMFALHKVLGIDGHVVAQVIEAEFVVGTEGDVGLVRGLAGVSAGLVLVDAVYAEAVEHI